MIAIFSTAVDQSTTAVLRWLPYLSPSTAVVRVNSDEPERVDTIRLRVNSIEFTLDGENVRASDLTTVWYRKGHHCLCNLFVPTQVTRSTRVQQYLAARVRAEQRKLSEYVHTMIERDAWSLGHAVVVRSRPGRHGGRGRARRTARGMLRSPGPACYLVGDVDHDPVG